MKEELVALARRAVACPRWRWMEGMKIATTEHMLTLDPRGGIPTHYGVGRVLGITGLDKDVRDGTPIVRMYSHFTVAHREEGPLPDLSDPATLGCLLALVREAWGVPDLAAIRLTLRDGSLVWSIPVTPAFRARLGLTGATEAEALVAALEKAP